MHRALGLIPGLYFLHDFLQGYQSDLLPKRTGPVALFLHGRNTSELTRL